MPGPPHRNRVDTHGIHPVDRLGAGWYDATHIATCSRHSAVAQPSCLPRHTPESSFPALPYSIPPSRRTLPNSAHSLPPGASWIMRSTTSSIADSSLLKTARKHQSRQAEPSSPRSGLHRFAKRLPVSAAEELLREPDVDVRRGLANQAIAESCTQRVARREVAASRNVTLQQRSARERSRQLLKLVAQIRGILAAGPVEDLSVDARSSAATLAADLTALKPVNGQRRRG